MKITQEYIERVVKNGNWIVRTDNDGTSYGGFKWSPLGEWTEAADWSDEANCQGGLFGQDAKNFGFCKKGSRFVFCETDGKHIAVGNKCKVRRARILIINDLPKSLQFGGSLDLEGTQITSLPEGLSVGGYLNLEGTQITSLPEGLSVGWSLYLRGTQITSLPEGLSVGWSLYLRGTQITSLPEGLSVGGSIYKDF